MPRQPLGNLQELDPRQAWQPAAAGDWNLKWAAHLYRRGAFGVPPAPASRRQSGWELLQGVLGRSREACVEQLLGGAEGQQDFAALLDPLGEQIAGALSSRFGGLQVAKLVGWWLYRMLHTPHPLRERLTLFWHGHFATSIDKVMLPSLMFVQNQLLRRGALGKFGPLAQQVSRDPAMLIWLDSNRNVKGRPNENYARELMELFTLGVGNYTERDVREVARAFTGWGTSGGKFAFNAALHDEEPKTVLGQTGNFDGADVVRILLAQPAAPQFIAGKLYRHFVSETPPPPAPSRRSRAQSRQNEFDIAATLRTIFHSRLFYSRHAYRQRIKSPVEYVVSLVRAFRRPAADGAACRRHGGAGPDAFRAAQRQGLGRRRRLAQFRDAAGAPQPGVETARHGWRTVQDRSAAAGEQVRRPRRPPATGLSAQPVVAG